MGLKQYREELGFTQDELAGFLGIGRTQLAKAERYHRDMPYKTISPSLQIDKCLMDKEALGQLKTAIKQQHWQQQVPALAEKQARKNEWAIQAMERKLAKMEEAYQQYLQALANVTKLLLLPNLSKGQTAALNMMEARIRARCHHAGQAHRQLCPSS